MLESTLPKNAPQVSKDQLEQSIRAITSKLTALNWKNREPDSSFINSLHDMGRKAAERTEPHSIELYDGPSADFTEKMAKNPHLRIAEGVIPGREQLFSMHGQAQEGDRKWKVEFSGTDYPGVYRYGVKGFADSEQPDEVRDRDYIVLAREPGRVLGKLEESRKQGASFYEDDLKRLLGGKSVYSRLTTSAGEKPVRIGPSFFP